VVHRNLDGKPDMEFLDAREWTTLFRPKRQWVYFYLSCLQE
jgi:hypothetical protein